MLQMPYRLRYPPTNVPKDTHKNSELSNREHKAWHLNKSYEIRINAQSLIPQRESSMNQCAIIHGTVQNRTKVTFTTTIHRMQNPQKNKSGMKKTNISLDEWLMLMA